jgi:hypothetical protein
MGMFGPKLLSKGRGSFGAFNGNFVKTETSGKLLISDFLISLEIDLALFLITHNFRPCY